MRPTTHIIFADDDEALRRVFTRHLERAGYAVHPASDGGQALALYAQHPGAIVVLDMVMPGRDGAETIMDFSSRHPEARILAISGGGRFPGRMYLNIATKLGTCATLAKPFLPEDLLQALGQILESPQPLPGKKAH